MLGHTFYFLFSCFLFQYGTLGNRQSDTLQLSNWLHWFKRELHCCLSVKPHKCLWSKTEFQFMGTEIQSAFLLLEFIVHFQSSVADDKFNDWLFQFYQKRKIPFIYLFHSLIQSCYVLLFPIKIMFDNSTCVHVWFCRVNWWVIDMII